MSGRIVAALVMLGSTALGGVKVVVELVPDNPGPYFGGESLTVDVWLHSQVPVNWRLPFIKLDFSDTDPSVTLNSTFVFDFTSLGDGPNYYMEHNHPEMPVPWIANLIECWCPGHFLLLPAEGALHIGSVGVRVPSDPGVYRIDALNTDEPDELLGAQIDTGSDSVDSPPDEMWRAYTGEIAGGTYDFIVTTPPPIPTLSEWGLMVMTLLLLGGGCCVIMRRIRAEARGDAR